MCFFHLPSRKVPMNGTNGSARHEAAKQIRSDGAEMSGSQEEMEDQLSEPKETELPMLRFRRGFVLSLGRRLSRRPKKMQAGFSIVSCALLTWDLQSSACLFSFAHQCSSDSILRESSTGVCMWLF